MITPPRTQQDPSTSAHDRVYRALRARIMYGRLAPGEALTLRGIGREFDVSMTPAREALRPRGVLGIWSLSGDRSFHGRMKRGGFEVSEHLVKKRGGRARQLIFVGRPSEIPRAPTSDAAARKSKARSKPSARRKPSTRGGGRTKRRA